MALQFLAPEILDAQATGYIATRMGNRQRDAAPQGLYACAGVDQWCAIGVDTDTQWQALKTVLGDPAWAANPELDSVAGRIEQHDMIDAQISAWTRSRTPQDVMDTLTEQGIPAGALQRSKELQEDPQYIHRGFQHYQDHPNMGRVPYAGNQFRIRGYAGGPSGPAPLLGEHNQLVYGQILGMSDEQIQKLVNDGVIK
jgi:crotonobetainyl-CoA:carnitine CoA-transferase CaiB-like acyl-CoA transferase